MTALLRYGLVSGAALAADVGTLRLLAGGAGVHYAVAATAGFGLGLGVNYRLSRRAVFGAAGPMRAAEFALFAAIGVLTLTLTLGVMSLLVEGFGVDYLAAKAVAAGGSFLANYTLRRRYVFAGGSGP